MSKLKETSLPRVLLAAALALSLAVPALAAPSGATHSEEHPVTADVTLRVAPTGFLVPSHWATSNDAVWIVDPVQTSAFNDQAGVAGCHLTVPDQDDDDLVDGVEVLDHALQTGCITSWDGDVSDDGVFVTEVDGREQVGWPGPWWLIQLDGKAAPVGIADMDLSDGQTLSFVYHPGP